MPDKRKYADCVQYLIAAVARRRKRLKELALEYKGGKCQICGYDKCFGSLEFHHLKDKKFGIGMKGYTRAWKKVKIELDKCILVCANCHREIEAGITQLPREIEVEKRGELREALNSKMG